MTSSLGREFHSGPVVLGIINLLWRKVYSDNLHSLPLPACFVFYFEKDLFENLGGCQA